MEEEEEEEEENPLLVPLEEKSVLQERQTSLWFGKVSSSVSEMKCYNSLSPNSSPCAP